MSTIELNQDNFSQQFAQPGIVFLDFWAEWCAPCLRFGPVFEAASEKNSDIIFGKIDTESQQQLAADANITSIPMLMAFRDGKLVFSQPGAISASAFDGVIAAVRDLDMATIK